MMTFYYQQSTGTVWRGEDVIGHGYSGHGEGLNNPSMENVKMVGPLPVGKYTINHPHAHPHLGPVSMALTPFPSNCMFDRSGFFIHGDNPQMNHTASDGCIILPYEIRVMIGAFAVQGEDELEVVA